MAHTYAPDRLEVHHHGEPPDRGLTVLRRARSLSTGARHALLFLVALVALFAAARFAESRAVVLVAFVVYVVVATVWVHGEYVCFREGRPWLMPWGWTLGFAVTGVAALIAFAVTQGDGLGLAGAISMYLAIGFALERWRVNGSRHGWWGLGLLAAAAVLGLAGALTLGRIGANLVPLLLIVAAALVALPLGLSLTAEHAIRWLSSRTAASPTMHWRVGGGGALLLGLVMAGTYAVTGSRVVVVAMIVLALLVLAVASATQADLVAVVALLALLGFTPHQASTPSVLVPGGRLRRARGARRLVHVRGGRRRLLPGDRRRRRQPVPPLADRLGRPRRPAAAVRPTGVPGLLRRGHPQRPGARAGPGRRGPVRRRGHPARQLPHAPAEEPVHTAHGGAEPRGNDSGFSTIGLMCLAPGDCSTQQSLWFDTLDQLELALRQAYDEIDAAFPATPVVVSAYPDPIDNTPDPATGRIERCGQVALEPAERTFVSRFVAALNQRVAKVAAEKGFHYLGQMEDSLAASHLQLCDPLNDDRPGLNFIGLRSVSGTAEQRFNPKNWAHGSLHPNERGHAAMLRTFQAWLTASGDLPSRASSTEEPQAYQGSVGLEAPCSLFDPSSSGCRPQGSAWAERQVGDMLFPLGGLAGVLAVAGAWALSVAVLGRRRRDGSDAPPPPPPGGRQVTPA
jgi:hypothetical protein